MALTTGVGQMSLHMERLMRAHGQKTAFESTRILQINPRHPLIHKLEDMENPDDYITTIGRILRITSIDEMPQLINVIKGEMSLIGPRPLICEEEEAHEIRFKNGVYSIRPGITGLAQVNGRDILSIEDKVNFDIEYLHSISLKKDLCIFFKSILVVLKRSDFLEGKR